MCSAQLPAPLQMKGVNLSCVRTCMVVAEERPRIALTQSFSKLFKDLGLPARAVSTTFGCRVNVAICLQVRGQLQTTLLHLPAPSLHLWAFASSPHGHSELQGFILKDLVFLLMKKGLLRKEDIDLDSTPVRISNQT